VGAELVGMKKKKVGLGSVKKETPDGSPLESPSIIISSHDPFELVTVGKKYRKDGS